MIRCRTIPRHIELLYAGLCLAALLVGAVGLVGGLITRFGPGILAGVVFITIGILNGRQFLYRTACELTLEDSRVLRWKSTLSGGELSVEGITEVVRAPHRPRVFLFRSADRGTTAFWLMTASPGVRAFFGELATSNPEMSLEALYGGHGWWKGLPTP
jgi:hypothetical protein